MLRDASNPFTLYSTRKRNSKCISDIMTFSPSLKSNAVFDGPAMHCRKLTYNMFFKGGLSIMCTQFVLHFALNEIRLGYGQPLITESLDKRKFFENTLRPYTSLATIDPKLSTTDYFNSSQVTKNESKTLRHFIDDYMVYHSANRWNGSKYLIFQPWGSGGLGDRTNHLLSAYWLAVISKRIFLVDWEVPFSASIFLANANPKGLKVEMFYDHEIDSRRAVTARVVKNTPFVSFLNASVHNDTSAQIDEEILMSSKKTAVFKWNQLPHSFFSQNVGF